MNIDDMTKETLENSLLAKLIAHLNEIPWLEPKKPWTRRPGGGSEAGDAVLVCKTVDGKSFALVMDCRKDPKPSLFPVMTQRWQDRANRYEDQACLPMLGAPYISQRMADLCKQAGWGWIDLAGNCRIDVPGIAHIQRSGLPAVHKRTTPSVNLATPEVARIMRVLLAPRYAGIAFTQRKLKELCEPTVSIGLVNKVVNYLKDEAYLKAVSGHAGFTLAEPRKLLDVWRERYRYEKHQRKSMFTLLKGQKLTAALDRLNHLSKRNVALASFSAATIMAPHVRQSKTWLYASERDIELLQEILEAQEVDSGDNLQVIIPEDSGVFFHCINARETIPKVTHQSDLISMGTTSAIQTYVDLWHAGGRGKEAAEALLNQVILPRWNEARGSLE